MLLVSAAKSVNKTIDQRFGANLKNRVFLLNFAPIFFFFAIFQLFSTKNAKHDYFNQHLVCAAPKHRSKYTTSSHKFRSLYVYFQSLFFMTIICCFLYLLRCQQILKGPVLIVSFLHICNG